MHERGVYKMGFPIIHTNFWDAVIAVPVVMILTQAIKVFFPIQPKYVPAIALALGLMISIFISHKHNFLAGVFMGFFMDTQPLVTMRP